ncbi:polysaccharide pyruvyl transferase family protein [Dysgonomonas termitidis]|uniref:Polysaccharide pyruvyl transferase family protein n=1 Tax=Dysgonomonas termitidis TaxID=1516126 RepID=A0ABV9KRF2_9BACT
MRIKTITCHEVYNYGATLQEYALLHYLQTLGYESQAIHYKPDYLSNHFDLKMISNPRFQKFPLKYFYLLAKFPERITSLRKKKSFDKFTARYLNVDTVIYKSNNELRMSPPQADVYICGSDQIWNPLFPNGKDAAFYLDFAPEDKTRLSYAASFAVDKIADEIKSFVYEKVKKLDAVSVRERSGVSILKELGISATQVLDPVFLLPGTFWIKTFVTYIPDKYVLVYDFDSNEMIEKLVKKIARTNNYKIFTVNRNISYADKNLWYCAPDMFLSLVCHAQYILTNSFHALAFSLIFGKQVCVVNRNEEINTRMRDLLDLVGLKHCLVKNETDFDLSTTIDYKIVNSIIEKHIEKSKSFLKDNLPSDEKANIVCH